MRTAFDARFDVPDGYLNTPSISVPPAQVADAVATTVDRWRRGLDVPADFEESVARSRQGFADLVGVPADRVAVGASVSQLLGAVAAGLPDGAKVLTAEGDFTSVSFPFAARPGVTVTEVPLAELPDRVAGHDLVSVSVTQSADGANVDLDALRAASEAAGVPVALDATQALGWQPLRLDWADWVAAAGYKWLLSPRGSAWLAVHPRALERGVPVNSRLVRGGGPVAVAVRVAAAARRGRAALRPVPGVAGTGRGGGRAAVPGVAGPDGGASALRRARRCPACRARAARGGQPDRRVRR